jgi:hypothetical protein
MHRMVYINTGKKNALIEQEAIAYSLVPSSLVGGGKRAW